MTAPLEYLDPASWLVILVTLILFVVAVFIKGVGHGLMLEAGVFLVSVKLIVMVYGSSVAARRLSEELTEIRAPLSRLEGAIRAGRVIEPLPPASR
jgi:Flp pilus assembly protein TadB